MLTFFSDASRQLCDNLSRRDFLRIGSFGVGTLTLADLLRQRAEGGETLGSTPRSVIMVYLMGGPSHMDMYDLKPEAPAEYRGEFRPIRTNVPGMDICELMPRQAAIADKLTLIRNMEFGVKQAHSPIFLYGGDLTADNKQVTFPAMGSVISKLWRDAGNRRGLPPYVALDNYFLYASWLGAAHAPFVPGPVRTNPVLNDALPDVVQMGQMRNLDLAAGLTLERVQDRAALSRQFDVMRRDLDAGRGMEASDTFQAQALAMITDPKVREAFDINREPVAVRSRYGLVPQLLLARRLAEAHVPFIQTTITKVQLPGLNNAWDLHGGNFTSLRSMLPEYDQAIHALVTDIYQRGLDQDVMVVIWGEFGRTPRVNGSGGRDHWPQAGFTLISGGGLPMGQVIGATDPRGGRPACPPYHPDNVLAMAYRHLGVDLGRTTIPDAMGRPRYLLQDTDPIRELT